MAGKERVPGGCFWLPAAFAGESKSKFRTLRPDDVFVRHLLPQQDNRDTLCAAVGVKECRF